LGRISKTVNRSIDKAIKNVIKKSKSYQNSKNIRGGPKKPKPKRVFDPKHPHVSTSKLIANRKK